MFTYVDDSAKPKAHHHRHDLGNCMMCQLDSCPARTLFQEFVGERSVSTRFPRYCTQSNASHSLGQRAKAVQNISL